jgi:hypothetical protein
VSTDGQAATVGGPSCILIPAGMVMPFVLSNIQACPNWNAFNGVLVYNSGISKQTDQSEAVNWTTQSGFTGTHNANHWPNGPNYASFIPSAATTATGTVTMAFQ